jgi:hypothetical protein
LYFWCWGVGGSGGAYKLVHPAPLPLKNFLPFPGRPPPPPGVETVARYLNAGWVQLQLNLNLNLNCQCCQ